MNKNEPIQIIAAIVVLSAAILAMINSQSIQQKMILPVSFSLIIIAVNILAKKISAYLLDSNIEHEIWKVSQVGLKSTWPWRFKKEVPAGIILPLLGALASIIINTPVLLLAILTYESRALKTRAAKRFGYYSYTEMTEWHNSIIGASGIIAVFILSAFAYLIGQETLAKIGVYYSFWNLLPISKLDGSQIFFGSKILWSVLAAISLIFIFLALIIP